MKNMTGKIMSLLPKKRMECIQNSLTNMWLVNASKSTKLKTRSLWIEDIRERLNENIILRYNIIYYQKN